MTKKSSQSKARQGIKDDSSLHKLYWEIRREREAMGLPPDDDSFDPKKTIAEWYREEALREGSAKHIQKTFSNKSGKRLVRQFTILIEEAPEHGYLAYCPAVNGKRLRGETVAEVRKKMTEYLTNHLGKLVAQGKPVPKTNTRIEKVKIPIPSS
jgi:predicted RNase H-like HicB family nuclease